MKFKPLSKEELDGLTAEAKGMLASRCALRVLPVIGCQRNFYFWQGDAALHMAAVEVAAILSIIQPHPTHDLMATAGREALLAARAARAAASNGATRAAKEGDDHKTASDVNEYIAASAATYAAESAIAAASNDATRAAAYSIIISGPNSLDRAGAADNSAKAEAERIINEAARADYMYILDSGKGSALEVFNLPLWPTGKPSGWESVLNAWKEALESINNFEMAKRYQRLMEGVADLDFSTYNTMIHNWVESYEAEFIGAKKFKEGGQSDSGAEENTLLLDLSGKVTVGADMPSIKDHLGRDALVSGLRDLLDFENQTDPLTIGLMGHWGSGKTSVLRMLEVALSSGRLGWDGKAAAKNIREEMRLPEPKHKFIFGTFNAWSYEHTGNIQAGLAQEVVNGLTRGLCPMGKLILALKLACTEHPWRLALTILTLVVNFGILLALANPDTIAWINDLQTWSKGLFGVGWLGAIALMWSQGKQILAHPLANNLKTYLRLPDFGRYLGKLPVIQQQVKDLCRLRLVEKGHQKRLIFVIDDLDRCGVRGVVKTLEAVRLVMELEYVTVIIAIDHRMALAALTHHYHDLAEKGSDRPAQAIARDYLGKIFQLPIQLEDAEDNIKEYVTKVLFSNVREAELLPENGADDKSELSSWEEGETATTTTVDSRTPPGSKSQPSDEDVVNGREKQVGFTALETEEDTTEPSRAPLEDSAEERERFGELAQLLQLSNPRQLKRLHNSYRLLKGLAWHQSRRRVQNDLGPGYFLSLMVMQFWLEHLYNLDVKMREDEVNRLLDGLKRGDNKLNLAKEVYPVLRKYLTIKTREIKMSRERYYELERRVSPLILPYAG